MLNKVFSEHVNLFDNYRFSEFANFFVNVSVFNVRFLLLINVLRKSWYYKMESIILSSKPTSQFPKNHGGDFRNAINHPLNVQYKLGQQFKVALAELFYVPGSWPNVRAGANYIDIQVSNYPVDTFVQQTVYYHGMALLNASVHQRFTAGT